MGEALLTGSALAAFLAGVVAFFAPCCATVMLPSYLAATTSGARRSRVGSLTALYVAGVATVVWPLTIGAASLASLLNRYHVTLFVAGGSLMIALGVATLRGWMWSSPLTSVRPSADAGGVYVMGVFAGAATACCAPVLAGAVTIAGVSSAWWVGAVLGGFYLLGLVTPLLAASLGIKGLKERLRDPSMTLKLSGRTLRTTRMRLVGALMFIVLGAFMIALALAGQADTAPGAQQAFGRWLSERATWLAEHTPMGAGWALMVAFVALLVAIAWRSHANRRLEEDSR